MRMFAIYWKWDSLPVIPWNHCSLQVHPSSVLESDENGCLPDYVVYHELINVSRPFMRNVCAVEMPWVMPILRKLEKMDVNKLRWLSGIKTLNLPSQFLSFMSQVLLKLECQNSHSDFPCWNTQRWFLWFKSWKQISGEWNHSGTKARKNYQKAGRGCW